MNMLQTEKLNLGNIKFYVCLFVTPNWSGTNALKFFIDNLSI